MRAEIIENIGEKGFLGPYASIDNNCYDDVENINKLHYASTTGSICYMATTNFFQQFRDVVFPRCGVCLELTGPSLRSATCQVIGSYMIDEGIFSNTTSIYHMARTIFVQRVFADLLYGDYGNEMNDGYIPVNVRNIQCPYKIYPMLSVISKNISHTSFKVFNANMLLLKAKIQSIDYYINIDHSFTIPNPETSIYLQIVSPKLHVILFKHITNNTDVSTAQTRFPEEIVDTGSCVFTPENTVIGNYSSNDVLFDWIVSKIPSRNVYYPQTTFSTNYFVVDSSKEYFLHFRYKIPFKIKTYFDSLTFITKATNTFTLNEPIFTILHNESVQYTETYNCSKPKSNITYNTTDGMYFGKLQMSIKLSHCKSYYNGFVIEINAPAQTYFELLDIHFDETNYLDNIQLCKLGTYQCGDVECNPNENSPDDGGTVHFVAGCEPICGSCLVGYQCTTSGKCVYITSTNTRTGSIRMSVILVLMIIFLAM